MEQDSESQQKFCLKWNQFSSHLKNTISNMRKADVLTDVTLMTEDGAKFTAHRIIMASASSFFRHIFSESNTCPWIYLKGVQSYQLQFILDFIYTGDVEIPEDELSGFLVCAGDLKIRGLSKYAGTINTKNVKVNIESDYIQPEHIIIDEQADNNFATVSYGEDIEGIPVADFGASNFLEINAELDKQIEEILVKNNGVWSCKVCGKFANHKSKLKQHVETHIEGFSHPCAICGKCYRSRNVLRMHLSRDHRNKKQNSKGSNNK